MDTLYNQAPVFLTKVSKPYFFNEAAGLAYRIWSGGEMDPIALLLGHHWETVLIIMSCRWYEIFKLSFANISQFSVILQSVTWCRQLAS